MNDTTYTLTRLTDTPGAQVYLMKPAVTMMGSTVFAFLKAPDDYIVITGDLAPCRNGVISNMGYGLGWFLRQSPSGYLCEKFLTQEFHPDLAREWLKEKVKELREELAEDMPDADLSGDSEAILELSDSAGDKRMRNLSDSVGDRRMRNRLVQFASVLEAVEDPGEDATLSADRFYDWYAETFNDSPENEGVGYDPREAELLGKLQQRFAELYRKTWPDACKG